MTDSMAPFWQVLNDRHSWISKYKAETGGMIAGYFCDYVPEEMIYAAGMTPVRITGRKGNVAAVERHLQSNVCSFARVCLDQALEGVYDYLDALVVPHTCDIMTKMYDLWAYRLETPRFIHYLWVPHKVFDKDAVKVMEEEIKRLKRRLEEFSGKSISDDDLENAIALYDRSRELLKRVYELRMTDPPRISGEQASAVSLAALLSPKDLFNQWAERFLEEHEQGGGELAGRPRVLVSASILDDLDLVRAIEDSGAWVVADDVCTGSRYFWDRVGLDEDSPVSALTRRYLNKIPCPRSVGSFEPRLDHILNLMRDYKADGALFYILRCCDAYQFQFPLMKERIESSGGKLLYIQGDRTVGVNENIINRISAFTEMLAP